MTMKSELFTRVLVTEVLIEDKCNLFACTVLYKNIGSTKVISISSTKTVREVYWLFYLSTKSIPRFKYLAD